uniref:Solute carrier family 35 member F2 n=1 Tax=Amphiprion percula TaxID=161767 RepID=A0A3P8RMW8_AMPPE
TRTGTPRGPTGATEPETGDRLSAIWFCSRHLVRTLAMGQGLAVLICGTAISSQFLASFQVNTPMLQSFIHYLLLLLIYKLETRSGDGNILQVVRRSWWRYFLLGLVDVEANYTVVKAYQYTTLTSIQLLDCFVIPVLMVLSWWVLKIRYRPIHYVSVVICLLGVGAMVGADLLSGRNQGSTSNLLLGDGLVLLSATLYAVSNICQEYTVKRRNRVEFLGMIGLFGTIISAVQMAAVRLLCSLYVCSVQLHAHRDEAQQRHLC